MANEFKIISEDGLKTLCKAIKKTSTIGEILDDANSTTDKTYSSFEIDRRLNTKIDKTQLTTVLDESVTDEQIPGAKVVYDRLKSINDFSVQVVKETLDLNDIVETGIYFFPQSYTPVNIPVGVNGWLLVMKGSGSNIVKQVWYRQGTANTNSYNTFERCKAGDTWSEWIKFLTEKDYYSALNSGNTAIPENADLNDYLTAGVYSCTDSTVAKTLVNCPHIDSNFKLIVNKNRGNSDIFYGYQMIVGTMGGNPVKDVCIYYRGVATTSDNIYTFSKWKIMSGSTVADVKETSIEFDKTALGLTIGDNHSLYKVINGVCYVTIELNVVPPSDDKKYGYTKINTTSLPKIGFSTKAVLNVVETSSSISVVLDKGSTDIKLHGNIFGREGSCVIQGTFSYPVAE